MLFILVCFVGTLKIFEDSTSFNSLVAVIVGLVIGTVVVVAAIVVILIKKKEIKDFICKVADRNRDLEEGNWISQEFAVQIT